MNLYDKNLVTQFHKFLNKLLLFLHIIRKTTCVNYFVVSMKKYKKRRLVESSINLKIKLAKLVKNPQISLS